MGLSMESGQQEVITPTEEAGAEVSLWLHHRAVTVVCIFLLYNLYVLMCSMQ